MMKYCYSYSIFGDIDKYVGLIIKQANEFSDNHSSSDAVFCVFVDSTYTDLKKYGSLPTNIKFICTKNHTDLAGYPKKLLRYLAHRFVEADTYNVRDADHTDINSELKINSLFKASVHSFLIVRSSIGHIDPICAGLFSYKKSGIDFIELFFTKTRSSYISTFITNFLKYRYDQILLGLFLYPYIRKSSMILTTSTHFSGELSSIISPDYLTGWLD